MSQFEVTTITEPDRRIGEAEEKRLTNLSRTERWRRAKEGRYPPKGELGPLLSEVVAFVTDPKNYRYFGDPVVTVRKGEKAVKVRQVRRRAVIRREPDTDEVSV